VRSETQSNPAQGPLVALTAYRAKPPAEVTGGRFRPTGAAKTPALRRCPSPHPAPARLVLLSRVWCRRKLRVADDLPVERRELVRARNGKPPALQCFAIDPPQKQNRGPS